MDYIGGHINNAINIQHDIFLENISKLIDKYHNMDIIIIHCMYSVTRGPLCCDFRDFYQALLQQTDKYRDALENIQLTQNQFDNLCKQRVLLLKDKFRNFVSNCCQRIEIDDLIQDFDKTYWNCKDNQFTMFRTSGLVLSFDIQLYLHFRS